MPSVLVPQILFLCTGNYYRSRFAELYFNHMAERKGLPHRAFSRGIEARESRNHGPISPHTLQYIQRLGIPAPAEWPSPAQLEPVDFDLAYQVIALDETEHAPLLKRDFPNQIDEVLYWNFPDVHLAEPDVTLAGIKRKIDFWINALKKDRAGAGIV